MSQKVAVLLVEDNPGDAVLVEEAFRMGDVRGDLHTVQDGVEAIDFLRKRPPYEDAPDIGLILLDLNLPRMSGSEVLAEIKADPRLKRIPVVVLTSSRADSDVMGTLNLHANCYIAKPVGLESLLGIVEAIDHFWLGIVQLAPR